MSDLLSAASLLLAVVGVLFGLWYPEITEALEIKIPTFAEDRKSQYKKVSNALYSKALPLTIAGIGVSLIFFPDTLIIIRDSILAYRIYGIGNLNNYNAVQTALCFVVVLSITISIYSVIFYVRLNRLLNRIKKK